MTSTTTCTYGGLKGITWEGGASLKFVRLDKLATEINYADPWGSGVPEPYPQFSGFTPATSTCVTVDDSSDLGGGEAADMTYEAVFYGLVLFLSFMWFVVWYFRGRIIHSE